MDRFNLENYVTVNDRIKAFWKDYPEGRIETELAAIDPPGTQLRMGIIKASLFDSQDATLPFATGFAKEREGTMGANKTAFLENAETSAIGRALATAGYGVDKNRASREEMEAVKRAEEEHQQALVTIKDMAKAGSDELKRTVKEAWANLKEDRLAALTFLNNLQEPING